MSSPSLCNINIYFSVDCDISFDAHTVETHLTNLNVNKAPGPDNFHAKILKNCAKGLSYPLSTLFSMSYSTGIIPKNWKLAHVVPVYKKGSKNNVENYRPISLTSIIMKTFEKIIRDDLMNRCADKILDLQHGFLPGRSCETQLIPFYDDLALSLNNCSRIDVIYFDFSKAFDSVNHDIILNKLKYQFNIDGKLLRFFVSYLRDRDQCVVIGGECSSIKQVLSGVPQGSILGPTLFILFINDIGEGLNENSKIWLYADDTKLYREIKNLSDNEKLQKDINLLNDWALLNKKIFHPEKCKSMCVTLKHISQQFVYKLGSVPIEPVTTEKDLGVNFTSSLSWSEHCNYLYS